MPHVQLELHARWHPNLKRIFHEHGFYAMY